MPRSRRAISWDIKWLEPKGPRGASAQLMDLADAYEDLIGPIAVSGVIAQQNMRTRFTTGTDVTGKAFADWAEDYRIEAENHPNKVIFGDRASLQRDLHMRNAALSPTSWRATHQGLFFDAGNMPEYWAWHNFGKIRKKRGQEMPTIPQVRLHAKIHREIGMIEGKPIGVAESESAALTSLANVLPKREFVGLTNVARAKILAMFEEWFTDQVTAAVSPLGKPFARWSKRDAIGRWAPRGS